MQFTCAQTLLSLPAYGALNTNHYLAENL